MLYPAPDPVALALGPLQIHWYGIMYLLGFLAAWKLARLRAARPGSGWDERQVDDLIFFGALGVVLGGRIGYTLFYSFGDFVDNPLSIFAVWRGGMSFHGGLLGVVAALWWVGRASGHGLLRTADFIVPMVPLGLLAGRIGNFINGELWGAPSALPWAMQVPCEKLPQLCAYPYAAGDLTPALHPSQLYEAGLEGLLLFLLLWWFSSRPRPLMTVSGLFLAGYALARILVEFVRLPDAHIGYLAFDWLTMGQLLSLPMLLVGIAMIWFGYRRERSGGSRVAVESG